MVPLLFSLLRLLLSPAEFREIALENLALRQQLTVMKRQYPRPRLRTVDRLFWGWLSRIWPNWRHVLLLVPPETVLSWHRQGFRLFWAWISRRNRAGRRGVSSEVHHLIRKMAEGNPLWGAPRIHGELLKVGINISERTVSRLTPKQLRPLSQTWKTFLNNHIQDLVSIDFFTVPTATFRVLFVLCWRVIHFNVTAHPSADWTLQRFREVDTGEKPYWFNIHNRDRVYSSELDATLQAMGLNILKHPFMHPRRALPASASSEVSTANVWIS